MPAAHQLPRRVIATCLAIFLVLFYVGHLSAAAPPWCQGVVNAQLNDKYVLCDPNATGGGDLSSEGVKSWCSSKNPLAASAVPFTDPDFAGNCSMPGAHCVEPPKFDIDPNTQEPTDMNAEICGFPVGEHSKIRFVHSNGSEADVHLASNCKAINALTPLEIFSTRYNSTYELLVGGFQLGFAIFDMSEETLLFQHASRSNYTMLRAISMDYINIGWIIAINADQALIDLWRVNVSGESLDIQLVESTAMPGGPILNTIAFAYDDVIDMNPRGIYLAFLQKDQSLHYSLQFFRLDESAHRLVGKNASPVYTLKISGTSQVLTPSSFLKFRIIEHKRPDKSAATTETPRCYFPLERRFLIMFYTERYVFFYGFEPTLSGDINISLNANIDAGITLAFDAQVFFNNSQTRITEAAAFGECFGNWHSSSQNVWLVTAVTHGPGAYQMNYFPVYELSWANFDCATEDPNWWRHPTANRLVADNCTLATSSCGMEKYLDEDLKCYHRPRPAVQQLSSKVTIMEVVFREPDDRFNSSTLIQHPEFVRESYQRYIFSATDERTIFIHTFQEIACLENTLPIINPMNIIPLAGDIISMTVSKNGQHLFAPTTKQEWQVISNQRAVDICQNLDEDPDNPFLEPYEHYCELSDPQPFTAFSYLNYFSECHQGFYCPLFGDFKNFSMYGDVEYNDFAVPEGYHTIRPICAWPCPPGFFCPLLGQRFVCPEGFKCPDERMSVPMQCQTGQFYEKACVDKRLTTEQPCPPGLICLTPVNAVPAPPGMYVPVSERSSLIVCDPGNYCALGRFNETFYTPPHSNTSVIKPVSLFCPANTVCHSTTDKFPEVCNTTYDINMHKVHDFTQYCPEGTFEASLCPAGTACKMPNMTQPCPLGSYCPTGSQFPSACKAGHYCPTPAEQIVCPFNHYCREGSVNPQPCHIGAVCLEGTATEQFSIAGVTIDIVLIVGMVVVYQFVVCVRGKLRDRRENKRISMRKSRAISAPMLQQDDNAETPYVAITEPVSPLLPPKQFTIDFEFENLGLKLKSNGKQVLAGVNGAIRHSQLVAIMGPSGAGKTTFLTTLAGRAHYGTRTGTIRINGSEKYSIHDFRRIVGFVPQEDIMQRELTVKEILRFSADTRLPRSMKQSEKYAMVDRVITVLGLHDVRHSIIGDESKRGISGGQRKRVNIGMELVADPTVLFLDEPTSGLDSTSSEEVLRCLQKVAETGMTIATVIHQPRYEIFTMFTHVLLLGKGGRTVYLGPSQSALTYFNFLGFECPEHTNPPDFFMDVISGRVMLKDDPEFSPEQLFNLWEQHRHRPNAPWNPQSPTSTDEEKVSEKGSQYVAPSLLEASSDDSGSRDSQQLIIENPDEGVSNTLDPAAQVEMVEKSQEAAAFSPLIAPVFSDEETRRAKNRRTIGFLYQLALFTIRSLIQILRDLKSVFIDVLLVFIAGSVLGIIYPNVTFIGPMSEDMQQVCPPFMAYLCKMPVRDDIGILMLLTTFSFSLASVAASMKIFGRERTIFRRESSTGINKFSYFLGKNIANIPTILLNPGVFFSIWYTLTAPYGRIYYYLPFFFLAQFAFSGYGYFFSILVNSSSQLLAGITYAIIAVMFSGVNPTLATFKQNPITLFVSSLSPARWCVEGLYLLEIMRYDTERHIDITSALNAYGFDRNGLWLDVFMLSFHALLSRLMSFFVLVLMDDEINTFVRDLGRKMIPKRFRK